MDDMPLVTDGDWPLPDKRDGCLWCRLCGLMVQPDEDFCPDCGLVFVQTETPMAAKKKAKRKVAPKTVYAVVLWSTGLASKPQIIFSYSDRSSAELTARWYGNAKVHSYTRDPLPRTTKRGKR